MKLKINNSHPRDKRIDFDENNRIYFIDGIHMNFQLWIYKVFLKNLIVKVL